MKKYIAVLAIAIAAVSCNNETQTENTLHLTGKIKGLKQGKLYIQHMRDTAFVVLDSVIFNGTSEFDTHIPLEYPEMLYLSLDRGQTASLDNSLPIFAEPGEMTLETSNDQLFARAKVTGSENQKLYEEFKTMKSRYTGSNLELVKRNLEATRDGDTKRLDSISEAMDNLMKRRYLFTANYAMNHANKEIGPFLALSEIYDANVIYLDTISKRMTPEVANSHYGKMLNDYIKDRKEDSSKPIE